MLPDIGRTKKERGESHEWTAGPMAVDNKQLKKYNKKCITIDRPNMVSFLLWYYILMP